MSGEETPSCRTRSTTWREEKRIWKPEPLRWGQQFKPKAGGGPGAAHLSDVNVVCPVPAASHAIGRVPLLWLPGVRRNEGFSDISSTSLLVGVGTCPGCPPGEGSSSLPSCGAGPLLLKVSGHCMTDLVASAKTPPTRSPAAFDH